MTDADWWGLGAIVVTCIAIAAYVWHREGGPDA